MGVGRAGDAPLASAAGGMRAYVDPDTGALLPEGPPAPPTGETSTSAAGLEETPGPDGSATLDLQHRFLDWMVAVAEPDGTVRLECRQGNPERAEPVP